jgi:predicted 3-demethylubiquinone-9 3-methyltransferase (glyoxalase superfamily)
MKNTIPKNTICLWFNKDAEEAARFYASTFPDSKVTAAHRAPGDYPSGKAGDVLTVDFSVLGIPCLGLNGGPDFAPPPTRPLRLNGARPKKGNS